MKTDLHKKYMLMAIAMAKKGIQKGQTPFGACIVKDGKVLSCVHNVVWKTTDITAHAEIHAIRKACSKAKSIDLSGAVIYSTCEPCPMCFSACHWARISKVIYGANILDAQRVGFNELTVSNHKLKKIGQSPIEIIDGFLKEENIKLFQFWSNRKDKRVY